MDNDVWKKKHHKNIEMNDMQSKSERINLLCDSHNSTKIIKSNKIKITWQYNKKLLYYIKNVYTIKW